MGLPGPLPSPQTCIEWAGGGRMHVGNLNPPNFTVGCPRVWFPEAMPPLFLLMYCSYSNSLIPRFLSPCLNGRQEDLRETALFLQQKPPTCHPRSLPVAAMDLFLCGSLAWQKVGNPIKAAVRSDIKRCIYTDLLSLGTFFLYSLIKVFSLPYIPH